MRIPVIRAGFAAAAVLGAFALAGAAVAQAPAQHPGPAMQKHDSNTLHKLGKAIQYPFQKAGTNLAVDTHRAEGRNSVVRRHGTYVARNEMVKPNGAIVRRPTYMHRRYRHSRWWYRHHHM